MLVGDTTVHPIRLLAIDPGTDTLGLSVLDIDPCHRTITLLHAYTYKASDHLHYRQDHSCWRDEDEKYLRLHLHGSHLRGVLEYYQPTYVVHESAFMGRFPKAYQGLTECLYQLRLTVHEYSPYLPFEGITPMEVKHAIKGIKKDEVAEAVWKIQDLINLDYFRHTLDEHAIDSIAIGYTKANQILNELTWHIPKEIR